MINMRLTKDFVYEYLLKLNEDAKRLHLYRTYGYWLISCGNSQYTLYHEQQQLTTGSLHEVFGALRAVKYTLSLMG